MLFGAGSLDSKFSPNIEEPQTTEKSTESETTEKHTDPETIENHTEPEASKKSTGPAVTYALDCGRFGDQLINYIKALWISYQYDIPLLYKPFSYSRCLILSNSHLPLKDHQQKFTSTIQSRSHPFDSTLFEHIKQAKNDNINNLYMISYFIEGIDEWEDEKFRQLLSSLIKPKKAIQSLNIPPEEISVALHVRQGGGYDSKNKINSMPTKFPPHSFYIHGIKVIADYFKDKPLYIHLFTDHRYPNELRKKYINLLKQLNISNKITLKCRTYGNRFDKNVLEDFFGMMQFDCLIRPNSSYSRAAAAVSGPLLEITPPPRNELRSSPDGNLLTDQQGQHIIDVFLKIRPEKGKNITEKHLILQSN